MHPQTGVISIENKEYRSGQRPRYLFFKFNIRTEGAWEGAPHTLPFLQQKREKIVRFQYVYFNIRTNKVFLQFFLFSNIWRQCDNV
jgi:hypothetical protein